MKTFNKIFFIIISILILISCNSNQNYSDTLIDNEKIKVISNGKISDMVKEFKIIPLETNDTTMISNIKSVKRRNGVNYVLIDDNMPRLLAFDDNGKFIHQFGRMGQGPGEYSVIADFDIDNEKVAIIDSNDIKIYDLEGNFQKKIPKQNGFDIKIIPDGFLLFHIMKLENGNRISRLNERGDTLETFATGDYDRDTYLNEFPAIAENTYAHKIGWGNELFIYDAKTNKSKIIPIFDSEIYIKQEDFQKVNERNKGKKFIDYDVPLISSITSNKNKILVGVMGNQEYNFYIIDKKNGKTQSLPLNEMEDDLGFNNNNLLSIAGNQNSDDEYFPTYEEDFILLREESVNVKHKFKNEYLKLKDLTEDSNPIICLIKF